MIESKRNIDFAISYAGEDLVHAQEVTTRLRQLGFNVFLAAEQRGLLVGVDGEHFFEQLFSTASQVVVFISEHYKRKNWPRYEWDVIRARDNLKRFIPIRVDDVVILGLPSKIIYLDVRDTSYDDIAKAAIQQLLLYERSHGIHRPSEFEVILNAICNDSKGAVAKAYQLVVDQRERTPMDDVEIPTAEWIPSYTVVETEWCDFSKVRRLSGRICVPERLGLDELTFNLKHCAASLFNELKPDSLMLFAYSYEPCRSREWGIFNAGRVIFAPHGEWGAAMDGVAYNLPTTEFEYAIEFASGNPVTINSQRAQHPLAGGNLVNNSDVWYAAILKDRFPTGVPIHGVMYSADELPCLPQDITRFTISAGPMDIGLGPTFSIDGSVRVGAIPSPFRVFDGAEGKRYLLHIHGYLLSPSGSVVWQQHGFPRGGAWISAAGATVHFTLIDAYQGPTQEHQVIIVAAGDPILSDNAETRVLLGIKEIILE